MNTAITLDATVVVAIITLFGVVYTAKMNTLTTLNKQLMELVQQSHDEIKDMKVQHAAETDRLEKKISILTGENIELKNKISDLSLSIKVYEQSNKPK